MATGKVLKTVGEINALLNAIENAPNIYTTPAQVEAQMEEGVAHLAEKDGSYPQMSVGFAEHLLGDGTATEEEFSFRPTAGVDRNVESTTYYYDMRSNFGARIEAVKGNSVVWNQLVDTTLLKEGTLSGVTVIINDDGSVTMNGTTTNALYYNLAKREIPIGNKVVLTGVEGLPSFYFFLNGGTGLTLSSKGILTCSREGTSGVMFLMFNAGITFNNVTIQPRITELTKMFGAGNEPTTIEEFYARLPIGVDLNAYNEGEIVNANYEAIKTTGFNQFNGTYAKVLGGYAYYLGGTYTSVGFTTEEGGTTEDITIPSNKLYTPSQNGYIYAEGSDICINLAWDEYASLNGTYKPYKPFERDLSWVAQYFPEGMRRAGDISDEIRFNSTTQKWEAVQNVDVRAYASGDENYTTFITDGTNTNYPLATPIVTEIEETHNLDYDVADYGTEELVVADGVKSAPFLGDIIYTPNAEKTLWQVPDILRRLTALEAAVVSATTTTE